jgi:2-polyprenyl-3-methyl-5-hydroxy-6-metoxy-1,4-benzoquinol methylase
MLYADCVPVEFTSGQFYDGSSYHLSPDKLGGDYSPVRFERELKLFRRYCQKGSVLDVGCSTGAFLNQLQTQFPGSYALTGTDVAGSPLDYAAGRGIKVIRGAFLEHDFEGERFDAITFWAVMEHLSDPGAFLKKAGDLLRPGGHCFILVPNMRSLAVRFLGHRYRYIMPEHLNYFTPRTLIAFANTEARFRMEFLQSTHFNPLVMWEDWKSNGRMAEESERARLLKKTTALKESSRLQLVKKVYRFSEAFLSRLGLADNLALVLRRRDRTGK